MKLVFCVVHARDKGRLSDGLVQHGFKFTVLGSSGGFLREGNATFMFGVEEQRIEELKGVIQSNCEAREQVVNLPPFEAGPAGPFVSAPVRVPVGGAVMFVVPLDEFVRF